MYNVRRQTQTAFYSMEVDVPSIIFTIEKLGVVPKDNLKSMDA